MTLYQTTFGNIEVASDDELTKFFYTYSFEIIKADFTVWKLGDERKNGWSGNILTQTCTCTSQNKNGVICNHLPAFNKMLVDGIF